jgi:hypothetical protein
MAKRAQQAGAVSIFAVIFAALLLTILTAGFIKIMLRDQQQATSNDLSQSAYDAALAGVEDAKRVIRACQQGASTACQALAKPDDCHVIARAGIVAGATIGETLVKSSSTNGQKFDQAYTCVNITMDTPDYLYEAREDKSQLIPLRAQSAFNQVVVEWYTRDDTNGSATAGRPNGSGDQLPARSEWNQSPANPAPPLMRAHVMLPGASFDLKHLDETGASMTAFLRPLVVSPRHKESSVNLASQPRATKDGSYDTTTTPISCSSTFANQGYACRVSMTIPDTSPEASANALLRLLPLYKAAHVRVSLAYNGAPVKFHGVQPSVDATGRASNLFRRVDARLQIGSDFPYPNNALEVNNSLCKDFSVAADKVVAGSCRP